MIIITSLKDAFRRCGLKHEGRKEYQDDEFTPEELGLLQAEPLLKVEIVDKGKQKQMDMNADTVADFSEDL